MTTYDESDLPPGCHICKPGVACPDDCPAEGDDWDEMRSADMTRHMEDE